MTERRFVLVDFRYTSDVAGHIRLYEAGNTYDMPRALAHAAAKRELVTLQRPVDSEPPSILRPPEEVTEPELAEAEAELKALQRGQGVVGGLINLADPRPRRRAVSPEMPGRSLASATRHAVIRRAILTP